MFDFEVEFAAFIGTDNLMGESIRVQDAEDHILGVVILNHRSVRDTQKRESLHLDLSMERTFAPQSRRG